MPDMDAGSELTEIDARSRATASSRAASDVADFDTWWGDVDIINKETGANEYHFGPVAYVQFVDGSSHRFQALTVARLNAQLIHLGIQVDCPSEQLNHAGCVCEICGYGRSGDHPGIE
ncbi:hypothetical protein [Candidatus Poriferisodalis sp.]|uniref:hypothetical protein n=1 Tax=Candidatus Poriferisodalis sp. TaxID=3101277 RepID=UPI003B5AE011